jgi:hypothetical protein
MAYTLRSQQVVFNGEMHGRFYSDWWYREVVPGFFLLQATASTIGEFTIAGPFGSFVRVSLITHGPITGVPGGGRTTINLECGTGFGLTPPEHDTDSADDDIILAEGATGTTEADLEGGTWSIVIDGLFLYDPQVTGTNYPTYGGAEALDPPRNTDGVTLLRALVGGEITVSASMAGASVTASHTFGALEGAVIQRFLTSTFQIQEGNGFGFIESKHFIDAEAVETSYAVSGPHNEANAGEGMYVYVEDDGIGTPNITYLSATHYPVRRYQVEGVIRAMEDAYPHTLRLLVDRKADDLAAEILAVGGVWEDEVEQHNWTAQAAFKETDQGSTTVAEYWPYRAWIAPTGSQSLTTYGEPTNHWRMLMRTFQWDAATITQASELQIAGANGGLTDGGNSFSLPDGSTDSRALGSNGYYTGKASMAGYRFLRLRLRHDEGSSQTLDSIGIAGKTWSKDYSGNNLAVPAGAGYTSLILDLCNPDGTEETDNQSTVYPLTTPLTESWAWGVNGASSIELNGIDSGVTWDVQDIYGRRHTDSLVTFLPTPDNFVLNSDTTTAELRMHSLLGCTDGRTSLEGNDWHRTFIVDEYVYTERAIVSLIDSVNGVSGAFPTHGWEMVDLLPAPLSGCGGTYPPLQDCFLNSDRPAYELCGAGATYDGDWTYWFDKDGSSALTLPAQHLIDSYAGEGGYGDVFETDGGAETGVTYLRFACILRGQSVGIVFNDSHQPAPGAEVEIDDGDFGSGTARADGVYQTGSPYVPGNTTAEVTADIGEGSPAINVGFLTRHRQRVCFRIVLVEEGVVIYFVYEDWHGHLHAVGATEGNIRYFRSNSSLPIPNWAVNGVFVTGDAETEGEDENPVVVRNWQDRLFILFDRPDEEAPETRNVLEVVSDDDGETWSEPTMAIPGGTRPFTITDRNGNQIEAAYVAGNIAARFRGLGETTWSDLFFFTDSAGDPLAVEDQPFSFDAAFDSPERFVLAVVIDGETSTSLWWSADEAADSRTKMSWTRVT